MRLGTTVVCAVLLLPAAVIAARDPAVQCATQKLAIVSRDTQCRLAAQALALRKGRLPVTKACDSTLFTKYGRLEQKLGGACRRDDVDIVRGDGQRFVAGVAERAQGRLLCSEDPSRLVVPPAPPERPVPTEATSAGPGVLKVADGVYMAPGFGNTFLVTTPDGNVVIDTSLSLFAKGHHDALKAIDAGPVRYVILTHGHSDHVGGVALWKEEGTQVIAQSAQSELLHNDARLAGVLQHRAFEQFSVLLGFPSLPFRPADAPVDDYGGNLLATTTFDTFCEFRLGGLTFQLIHTPGETYDHLSVWIAEAGIAFTGDNIYGSFPNLYTLRGTKPRWALDYVESLDRVASWQPAILAPSHENPTYGVDANRQRLQRYRDAILYVHDATVQGMNAGIDVFTLMQTITLPPELDVGEGYGAVAWTVRGIYEGYIGWFDENPATMYAVAPADTYRELLDLYGDPAPILARAAELVTAGRHPEAIRLTDVVLAGDPGNVTALQTRLAAVDALLAASGNINERGWLNGASRSLRAQLGL